MTEPIVPVWPGVMTMALVVPPARITFTLVTARLPPARFPSVAPPNRIWFVTVAALAALPVWMTAAARLAPFVRLMMALLVRLSVEPAGFARLLFPSVMFVMLAVPAARLNCAAMAIV